MKTNDFMKIILYLGSAFNKQIEKSTIQIWYEYLKEADPNIVMQAVKNLVVECEYLPSISKIISECQKVESGYKYIILDKMLADGYFKYSVAGEQSYIEEMLDYNKAVAFASKEIIPGWLEEDMMKYGYKKPTIYNPNNRIETNTTKLISE
jgi:hypothetical protein